MNKLVQKFIVTLLLQLISHGDIIAEPINSPRLSEKKIILDTIAGEIILVLYPEIAPQHVNQLIKLTDAGILNGTHFYRIHSNFVAQTSSAEDRLVTLTPEQKNLIKKIPAEFSNLPHKHGILSMAREDDDINSAETSFSILLGDAPHLDGKYTIFGNIIAGYDVLNEFLKVSQEKLHLPDTRLTIISARSTSENIDSLIENRKKATQIISPTKPIDSGTNNDHIPTNHNELSPLQVSVFGLGATCILNSIACLFYWFTPSVRTPLSLTLMSTLCGYFCFIIVVSPIGQREPLIALGLFSGLVLLFKLLSLFDRPDLK